MGLFSKKTGPTVLVCEGSADTLTAVCKTLKKEKFDIVGKTSSGKEGLEKWIWLRPQITLIGVPLSSELGGVDLLREIRKNDPHAVVLFMGKFMATDAGRDMVREVIAAGASDILAKTNLSEVPSEILIKKMRTLSSVLS